MILFADSSALVKLYADEPGHDVVRRSMDVFVVSQLARVEVPAALWRKHRTGELGADDVAVLVSRFEHDFHGGLGAPPRFVALAIGAEMLEEAARHVARHALRAYDAVQLACAGAARELQPGLTVLVAFDGELRRAAAAEGFGLLPAVP